MNEWSHLDVTRALDFNLLWFKYTYLHQKLQQRSSKHRDTTHHMSSSLNSHATLLAVEIEYRIRQSSHFFWKKKTRLAICLTNWTMRIPVCGSFESCKRERRELGRHVWSSLVSDTNFVQDTQSQQCSGFFFTSSFWNRLTSMSDRHFLPSYLQD